VTAKSRGYGFVRFVSETAAATARKEMNDQVFIFFISPICLIWIHSFISQSLKICGLISSRSLLLCHPTLLCIDLAPYSFTDTGWQTHSGCLCTQRLGTKSVKQFMVTAY